MDIPLTVDWTNPPTTQTGTATVTFTEVMLTRGYKVREITSIVWPTGFPRDQKPDAEHRLLHLLNTTRQGA